MNIRHTTRSNGYTRVPAIEITGIDSGSANELWNHPLFERHSSFYNRHTGKMNFYPRQSDYEGRAGGLDYLCDMLQEELLTVAEKRSICPRMSAILDEVIQHDL